MGSKVTSSAQSRCETSRTRGGKSMATDVCMLILTKEGGEVWVEDDTVVVQGVSDWTPTSNVRGNLGWAQSKLLRSCPTVSYAHFSFAALKMWPSSKWQYECQYPGGLPSCPSCILLCNLHPSRIASMHPGAACWPYWVPLSGRLPSLQCNPNHKPVPRKRPNFNHLELSMWAWEIFQYCLILRVG